MNIAYITGLYPSPSETFIAREIAGMRRRGHQVTVFSLVAPVNGDEDGVNYGWVSLAARSRRKLSRAAADRALGRRWRAAIAAQGRVGLMLNARKTDLDAIVAQLPALNSPTISHLSDPAWVALNTILDEATVRDVIPKLKAAGATGIVEYPLSKVVL